MEILLALVAMASLTSAQIYDTVLNSYKECRFDPMLCRMQGRFVGPPSRLGGRPGDVTWNTKAGQGQVFGTLGSTDQGLFGKAGYQQTIFNDARGKLEAEAHGTRVLSPVGDSSHFGGGLEWSNKDASASVDVNKQVGGATSFSATGTGKWHPEKNTEVSASGSLSHAGQGRPDVAVEAKIEHKF